MTTRQQIHTLKKINQRTQNIVFGYIHQQYQSSLPQLINYLCLMFYHSKWDQSSIDRTKLKIEGNTLTWTDQCEKEWQIHEASLINDHCLKWTFRINQLPIIETVSFIGFTNEHSQQKMYYGFELRRKGNNCYISNKKYYRNHTVSYSKYGTTYDKCCNIGDSITMKLNSNTNQLKLLINNKDYGTVFTIFEKEYKVIVRATTGFSITAY